MSIADWILSFSSFFLTTWPIPSWEEGVYANMGNMGTCQAQGFLCSSLPPIRSIAYLATYYVLVVRYSWQEDDMRKYEYTAHAVTLLFSLGTAIAGFPLSLYNNYAYLLCWISESPHGCVGDDCVRGVNAIVYQYAFYFVWIWVSLIVMTFMMTLLYWTLHKTAKANQRYASAPSSASTNKSEVAKQAFLYIFAYFLVNLFPTIQLIVKSATGGGYFVIYLLNGFFFPMQGMFNALIYLRPRYLRYKKRHPEASRSALVRMTITNKPIVSNNRRSFAVWDSLFPRLGSTAGRDSTPEAADSSVGALATSTAGGGGQPTMTTEMKSDDYKLGTMYDACDEEERS